MSGHFPIPSGLAIFVPTREVSSLHLLAGAPITLHPTNVCLLVRCLLELGGQVPIISGAFPSLPGRRRRGGHTSEEKIRRCTDMQRYAERLYRGQPSEI